MTKWITLEESHIQLERQVEKFEYIIDQLLRCDATSRIHIEQLEHEFEVKHEE